MLQVSSGLCRRAVACARNTATVPLLRPRGVGGDLRLLHASAAVAAAVPQDDVSRKFVNYLMQHGKKATAERIFQDSLEELKVWQIQRQQPAAGTSNSGKAANAGAEGVQASLHQPTVAVDPVGVFFQAVDNVKPTVGLVAVRRGGRVYQVPSPLNDARRQMMAMKWIIGAARAKTGKPMSERLARELIQSYNHEVGYGPVRDATSSFRTWTHSLTPFVSHSWHTIAANGADSLPPFPPYRHPWRLRAPQLRRRQSCTKLQRPTGRLRTYVGNSGRVSARALPVGGCRSNGSHQPLLAAATRQHCCVRCTAAMAN